jgi:tRNA U34 5-carboxymethylaminomethyl modifying GTPase MnmE/TrmE
MKLVALLVAAILAASVTVPNVFSDDEGQKEASDQKESSGNLEFGVSSATTDLGLQISDIVHKRNDLLKQQRNEAHDILKQCRDLLKNSSDDQRHAIKQECKAKLKALKEKYKAQLLQLRQQIKQLTHGTEDDSNILTEKENKNFFNNTSNHLSEKSQKNSSNKNNDGKGNKKKNHSD